ncbi:hypothetical protein ACQ1Y8_16380, partial [Enterococcus faecalis]|uniref:hypothetical protein n=1 Tax=Enterococcus faecalis TaxID=1351 RepID=UPI003D6BEEDB
ETGRPNNSLHAHALLLLTKIATASRNGDLSDLDPIWNEFITVIEKSTGLGGFPFESIAAALTQFGDLISDSSAFD